MTVDRRHGPLPVLLVGLTVVTGLVDAFSFLRLGHVFVANMTGNVVFLGLALAGVGEVSIAASLWLWWPSPSAQHWAGGGPQGEWCTAGTFWQPPHQFRRGLVLVASVIANAAGAQASAVRLTLIGLLALAREGLGPDRFGSPPP